MKIVRSIISAFSSYLMAVIIFTLLLVLVFLGTLEQTEHGIFEVQKKYFSSFFLIHDLFGVIPVPLPGVALLLGLLSINLIVGGVVRIRKDFKRAGVLIIHFGILLMIAGGAIQWAYATDGHMTLYEGEQASQYESYYLWELAIAKANEQGEVTEYVIPGKEFSKLGDGEDRTFTHPDLPFDLRVHGYHRNCQPMPKGPMFEVNKPVVNGLFLQELEPDPTAEANIAGFYATVRGKKTGEETTDIVWGKSWWRDIVPMTVQSDGATWAIELRKKRYEVPFTIKLDDFTRELHPGTQMAASFSSDVTKFEEGNEQRIHIAMNEPLRHEGYTFFQASWGPEDAKPGQPLFSTFAVVDNPADKFPLYACVMISIGLVLHFGLKLTNYLRAETRRAK